MVDAIQKELISRKDYINTPVKTIYFGGGTPSLLSKEEIAQLIDTIKDHFGVEANAEITLEANPDDLTEDYIYSLRQTPVNRLSIGVQSFRNADLQWMNRAHNAEQALKSIHSAAAAGFSNLSIDLIYGIPGMTNDEWKENLDIALQLPVQHLSCYCLTVEPKTALGHFVKKNFVQMPGEEISSQQFLTLIAMAAQAGFEQYEISNLSKPGFVSQHNSSYWKGVHYLGVGPSAHSFNGISREWNVSNNALYIKSVNENNRQSEMEVLTPENRFNEYIMVSLRTAWGIDINYVQENFGKLLTDNLIESAREYIEDGTLVLRNNHLILTGTSKLIADRMASELFI